MNDCSYEHKLFLKRAKSRNRLRLFLQIFIAFAFIILWELLTRLKVINPFIFSSPSRAIKMTLNLLKSDLLKHIGITLFETVVGFLLGSTVGYLTAILLWWSPLLKEVSDPYLVIINSLPKIALGPIIIVWVGAGISSIITVTLLISVVVAVIGILNGFNEVEKDKTTLLKTFGATKMQVLTKVIIPASMSTTVSVLKLNIGMSWVGVIVGEFLNSKSGLGYLIVYGGQVFKMDIVMSATIILCILSALMYFGIVLIEKALFSKNR